MSGAPKVRLASGASGTARYGAAAPTEYDVVIDTVGGGVLDASYQLTRRGGRLVTLSAPPSDELAAARGTEHGAGIIRQTRSDAETLQEIRHHSLHLYAVAAVWKMRSALDHVQPRARDGRGHWNARSGGVRGGSFNKCTATMGGGDAAGIVVVHDDCLVLVAQLHDAHVFGFGPGHRHDRSSRGLRQTP